MNRRSVLPLRVGRSLLLPACAFALCGLVARAQTAPTAKPSNANAGAAEDASPPIADDTVVLSPFEVTSTNKGYFSSNTMSGTRFNTKLEDLGSSITVVSKEQMSDFAMLDINDVFAYVASAEGAGTYTAYTVDRNGSVSDSVQLNPTQANRVRGIAPANVSYGNYETQNRVPVDPIMLDAVELSRGPNANVFGLGNPSGTLNQVPVSANLTRQFVRVAARTDDYGGYRGSVDVNQVLKKGMIAIRASAVEQHESFVRKPSGVETRRYNAMIKVQPFKYTTISALYMDYRMHGTRPNFTPPRDSVTYWLQSGKPTWDPVGQVIHVNGTTLGPFTSDTAVPDYFNRTFTGSGRAYLYVDQSGLGYWSVPSSTSATTPITASGTRRLFSPSPAAGTNLGKFTNQPLFTTTPSVKDQSIYDWSSINLASVNYAKDQTATSLIQIDQILLDTPMQTLAAQLGFFREDSDRFARNIIGQGGDNGQTGQLLVDVNETLIDGKPNPYFMRPYIGVDQPRTVLQPATWDTYRAQLAYKLDLTHQKSWLRWIGAHQLSGYSEYKYRVNRQVSYKDVIANDPTWMPANTTHANQGAVTGSGQAAAPNITRGYFRYYVGDATGSNVDYAPGDFRYGLYPFIYGNPTNGFVTEQELLGPLVATDATGGANNSKTVLKTLGAVMQSFFLDNKLVTTVGLREDKQFVKNGITPQLLNSDMKTLNEASVNGWAVGNYRYNSGKTKTIGGVLRPLTDVASLKRMENNGGLASFLAQTLRGLSLTYNYADSFIPQDPRISLYQNQLPNPSGTGRDYGIWLSYGDKLVIRLNHYHTLQTNARGTDASTIAQRVLRIDVASTAAFLLKDQATNNWAPYVLAQQGITNPTQQQILDYVAGVLKMPTDQQNLLIQEFNAGVIASTQDIDAKGTELEINYNPTRYWTVSASATEGTSTNSNVSPEIEQWIQERMKVWTTVVDPIRNTLWWNTNYGGSQTPAQNYATFVQTPYSVIQQLNGKANPQVRRYNAKFSTSYDLSGLTSNHIVRKFTVGGALRWESKGAIGYYGKNYQQLLAANQPITELDASNPIYDKAHTYVDLFAKYRTRLFSNRVNTTVQLNVRNVQESGRLQPIGAYPDGTPNTYRIVDPRQFILQVNFEL